MAIVQLAPAQDCSGQDFAKAQAAKMAPWLLSLDPETASEVVTGPEAGKLLKEYIEKKGTGCLGTRFKGFEGFPLAIRWIDTADAGLVQALPDGDQGLGVWYIIKADNANVGFACKTGFDAAELQAAAAKGDLSSVLDITEVNSGDVLSLNWGSVYWIDQGITLVEILQTAQKKAGADSTGEDEAKKEWLKDGQVEEDSLADNDIFAAELFELNGRMDMDASDETFKALVCVSGSAVIEKEDQNLHAQPGTCFFVEAGTEPFHITGNCAMLCVSLA